MSNDPLDVLEFIEVPTIMLDSRNKDLTGKTDRIRLIVKINPNFISSYYQSVYEDAEEANTVTLISIGGNSFYADMPIEGFDELIATFKASKMAHQ